MEVNMSHEAQIHDAQTKILRELLFIPETNFAELQKVSGLESDHAKFHIKRLVELGYIDKNKSLYRLSIKGKEYANKLDTDAGVIERQPKVAVMLIVEREQDGEKEYLLQERLKHPYYGYWGPPTGKVRWGESIVEAAARELEEETGLEGVFEFRGINHERVLHDDTGEIVEDKIFNLMFCKNALGKLKVNFDGGRNAWRTLEEMKDAPKKYKSFDYEMKAGIEGIPFSEIVHHYGADEF
jgi:8-oxo-dGTP diphosphatase